MRYWLPMSLYLWIEQVPLIPNPSPPQSRGRREPEGAWQPFSVMKRGEGGLKEIRKLCVRGLYAILFRFRLIDCVNALSVAD